MLGDPAGKLGEVMYRGRIVKEKTSHFRQQQADERGAPEPAPGASDALAALPGGEPAEPAEVAGGFPLRGDLRLFRLRGERRSLGERACPLAAPL
ncbi:MAG TPA: hypothetical protein VN783_12325, partial [Thermoanaerobaculia bacterium]|nr:hypothetical protein [Thermoanaerobaculia bacterium]